MHESWIKPEFMDSDEEREFYAWLLEAEYAGLITDIEYQPGSLSLSSRASIQIEKKLKTKTKMVEKFLLHRHEYTPDFVFEWTGPGQGNPFVSGPIKTWVDVKGGFNAHGDPKQFSINQKWVYQKFGIFVNKVVPEKLFCKTWVPEDCRWTPKRHDPVKKYIGVLTVDEFCNKVMQQNANKQRCNDNSTFKAKEKTLVP